MVCDRLREVEERILKACERSGRKREEVLLLGASKGVRAEELREFFSCGLKTYGENRVQEFLRKEEELRDLPIDWHFIGRLQSNKVKYVIDKVSLIHSLDRESLLEELRKRAGAAGKVQEVLVEVNVGGEETKGGVKPENLKTFFESCMRAKELKVLGLMCMPPYRENPQEVRGYFALLRRLRDQLEADFRMHLPHLSMGMSHDFEVAIEEGSTIVRIGTLLFGARG
ncbi:MAG: YggS family pyridoxal phosphate-dependent enzyme [Aquificaceae bacterium]|nr:YggS family pyridoxal phosphate-dependent enzyme [Aquificaceae bacterium]MCX7989838.1 YggS family pyridoxal phosphate-dependent enzyme [Aquificaceae bacterium]MDW8294338.1 YggS family pyridoxal phosphate-dependent enzyme [Aquificaceae bacterium]